MRAFVSCLFVLGVALSILPFAAPVDAAPAASCTPSILATVRGIQGDRGEVVAVSVSLRVVAQPDAAPRLRQVRFISTDNATVEFPFQQTRPVPSALPLDGAASSADFVVRRSERGQPFALRYAAADNCGDIEAFVGILDGGASIYSSLDSTPPAATSVPRTATPVPSTPTRIPPTSTRVPPTSTRVPATATPPAPIATGVPATPTPAVPTATASPVSPTTTGTAELPTATPVPTTAAPELVPPMSTPMPTSDTDPARFVSRQGATLTRDGQPFRFIGFNLFDAAGQQDGYKCAWWGALSDAELDATLARMRSESGATVLRFWAFQSYTNGGTDWSGIDRVIRLAKKNDMLVIPTIENGPEHCSEGGTKWKNGGRWFSEAYKRDYRYGYALSLPDYTERLVGRYRDEPAILGWMIMNEAETDNVSGMYDFAREMSALVKRIDPNHLVALGTQSSGQAGTRGADFMRVHGLPTIDFIDGHDYGYWGQDANPLPGSPDGRSLPDPNTCDNFRAIACSIAQSVRILQKPFIVGEAGIKAGVGGSVSTQQRAALFEAKVRSAFWVGVAGYMPWQGNRIIDEGYDLLPDDPMMPILRRIAEGL